VLGFSVVVLSCFVLWSFFFFLFFFRVFRLVFHWNFCAGVVRSLVFLLGFSEGGAVFLFLGLVGLLPISFRAPFGASNLFLFFPQVSTGGNLLLSFRPIPFSNPSR